METIGKLDKKHTTLTVSRSTIGFLLLAIVVSLFYSHLFVLPLDLRIGQLVPFTIASPAEVEWVDSGEYVRVMSEADSGWVLDPSVAETAVTHINSFFDDLRTLQVSELSQQNKELQLGLEYPLDDKLIRRIMLSDPDVLSGMQTEAVDLVRKYLATRMDLEKINTLQQNIEKAYVSQSEQIAVSFLRPNVFAYQADNPEELFKDFFTFKLRKGDIIISEGQQVSQQVLDKLDAVKSERKQQDLLTFIGLSLMFFLELVLWAFYIWTFKKPIWNSPLTLAVVSLILIVSIAACILIIRIPFAHFFYMVSIPLIIGSILVCVVYDSIFALYLFGGIALLVSWLFNFNIDLLIFNVVGAIVPPVCLSRMSTRKDVVKLGFFIAAINFYIVGVIVLVGVQSFSVTPFVIAFLSGIAASIFALGSQLFLDQLAVPLTRTRLNDLADTNSPLLQKLMLSAPGTYNHSLVMSQMVGEAAHSIGADALLAKVGALYHDIGKITQPKFFAENLQDLTKNPHTKLEPKSSYNIIIQHIEKGVELARKHKLPEEVINFIVSHHGTSVMKYFYHAAAESSGDATVDPREFSYPGPTPETPETSIVNLADSVEAIVRAKQLTTESEIRDVIDEVIDEKLKTGQFDKSDLSVRQLKKVTEAFIHVLTGIHHSRVKYPGDEDKESEPGKDAVWFDEE